LIITITISQEHLRRLETIAKERYPAEACALLEGNTRFVDSESNEVASVRDIVPMRNADESVYTFRIDPNELLSAYKEISSRKLEVVGIFHSHSSEAFPSLTDRKYMELNPVVWLIYSTLSNSFAAYILDNMIIKVNLKSSSPQHSS
jgi:proteasome lid subunit RPN8/RPN11